MSSSVADRPSILIIDQCLDRASGLRKKIETSGIKIRINTASTPYELEHSLHDPQPLVAVASSGAFEPGQAEAAVRLLDNRKIPVVLCLDEGDTGFMYAALRARPCEVVHATESEHLLDLIRQLMDRQKAAEESVSRQFDIDEFEQRIRQLFHHSTEAIAYIHEGFHVDANKAYLDYLRTDSVDGLGGRSILELMRGIDTDLREVLRDIGRGQYPGQAVAVSIQDDRGETFVGEICLSPVRLRGEDCVQVLLRGVDQHARLRQEVSSRRTTDELTGMLNRASFLSQLTEYLAHTEGRAASNALLYLRPDGFDDYQDTLGHVGADQFLAEFAGLVNRCLSENDIASRFSDDGLVVLLRRDSNEPMEPIAQAILDATAEHVVTLDHLTLKTRCSIGMATIGPSLCSADEAISQARMACRHAAEQGHCLVRYKPKLSMVALDASSRAGWEERLRFGLDHGNFYSLQHSIVNLEDESEGYLESRSYLREEQGDIDQQEFLPAAVACNVSAELDRAILPGLLDTIANQPGTERHILNICAGSLADDGFPAWFGQQLAQRRISGDRLLLQAPADVILANPSRAEQATAELRQLGCQFAISGFGSEPRHLKLLGETAVTLVKLDSVLSRELVADEAQRDRVRSLVKTANGAGVEVMVDGICDAGHLAALWQSGIKLVAGEFLQEASQVVGQ